ncbi:MAG: signal peptidase I [Clostridia bacterium]|nr:signal peptidase I [Clostridia bacterium]
MNIAKEVFEWIICIIIALILAFLIRYFIGTPTIVKHSSMYPTLKENQRLLLNRTHRITNKTPEVGDIITFEAPSKGFNEENCNQEDPRAIYTQREMSNFEKFGYNILEVTKTSYIKRVIALEGTHVQIQGGKVYINGELFEEDYLEESVVTNSEVFNDFVVPEGYVFAMGDNRENSVDCRELGCIPLDKIEGTVLCRWWPITEFKGF